MIRNLIKTGIALRTLDLNRSTPAEEFFLHERHSRFLEHN